MATKQQWETLTVQIGFYGIGSNHLAARFVNGVEIEDWKEVPLHAFITRLGAEGWEMSGAMSITGISDGHCLFFKRPLS